MATLPTQRRERVARNFVRRYGAAKFAQLIDMLSEGQSGQHIADEFQVSRERVRQWKNTFGQSITLYQMYPEVADVLAEVESAEETTAG